MCIQTKVAVKQLEIAIISSGLDFFFKWGLILKEERKRIVIKNKDHNSVPREEKSKFKV